MEIDETSDISREESRDTLEGYRCLSFSHLGMDWNLADGFGLVCVAVGFWFRADIEK